MARVQDKPDGGQLFNDFYVRFVEDDFKEEPDSICALLSSGHSSCNKTCILQEFRAILG